VDQVDFFFLAALVILAVIGIAALSGDRLLRTEPATPADVQGMFTLHFHGCGSREDIENVAIFDREGDAYSFVIADPALSCTARTGMPAAEAIRDAERFVRCNIHVERSRLRRILGPAGAVVGFELAPLYPVEMFGRDDVIDTRYTITDRTIGVRIKLDPSIERSRMG
jgi:hypothetical protein